MEGWKDRMRGSVVKRAGGTAEGGGQGRRRGKDLS